MVVTLVHGCFTAVPEAPGRYPETPRKPLQHFVSRDAFNIEGLGGKNLEKFCRKLKIFKIGYSWGGFESLITFPISNNRKYKDNIKGNIVRVYCGLEDNEDQILDILNAIKVLS